MRAYVQRKELAINVLSSHLLYILLSVDSFLAGFVSRHFLIITIRICKAVYQIFPQNIMRFNFLNRPKGTKFFWWLWISNLLFMFFLF